MFCFALIHRFKRSRFAFMNTKVVCLSQAKLPRAVFPSPRSDTALNESTTRSAKTIHLETLLSM